MGILIIFITHIFKMGEYFLVEGLPETPLEQLPAAVEGFIFNVAKLAEIYASML